MKKPKKIKDEQEKKGHPESDLQRRKRTRITFRTRISMID